MKRTRRCMMRASNHPPVNHNYHTPCIMRASNQAHVINSSSNQKNKKSNFIAMAQCLQCHAEYESSDVGTCKLCYNNGIEIEENRQQQIKELKSQVAFLKMSCPINRQNDTNFADISLIASDELTIHGFTNPVPVHKAVLVSRSPVFSTMFQNDGQEVRDGIIMIPEVSAKALYEFVKYLYQAEATLDYKLACEVLMLAEKYQVMHLKTYCEKYLATQLNYTNSLATFSFAQQHNATKLQEAASKFMARQNRDSMMSM